MDEKFIQALGGSVDEGFVSLLRQSAKSRMPEKKRSPKRSPRGGISAVSGGSRRKSRKIKMRGGSVTWMEHVRLTAGAGKMCWKDAMREASKTWNYV